MLRIGDAAKQFSISNRTLRYWEDEGILISTRAENGYRYYDDDNAARIKQIILLRKLKMPINEIEKIFVSNQPDIVVSILTSHLEKLMQETAVYNSLVLLTEKLIGHIKSLKNLELSMDMTFPELENALQIVLSERNNPMSASQLDHVRIVKFPVMVVASYRAESTSPEDFVVPAPLVKKQFNGGMYASISARMNEIGERWQLLYNWCKENEKYDADASNQWLEECSMDFETFISGNISDCEKQLDLLEPVKER